MQELYTNLVLVIMGTIGIFAIVYSLVRLAAIAWHKTKAEFDSRPFNDEEFPNHKRQNDEEL